MRKNKGFTMIELLIVIVILGLLASLVAPKFFNQLGTAERGIASAQMNAFETALDTYRLDMGSYPSTLEELRKSDKPRWDGPYLPKEMSYAADGQPGGSDNNEDIVHK